MSPKPRASRRPSPGVVFPLGAACVTAAVLLTPPSARAFLWPCSLLLFSILAGLLLARFERRAGALNAAYRGALEIMARLIDSVERHSENHSRRVAESAVEMALALRLSATEIEDVRVGAFLHDLGGLDIPAEFLAQAAGIAPEALDEIGFHERRGIRAARAAGGTLRHVVPLVACCRERWDGTGRRALEAREIPLGARILAVADAYDALVTDRAYRKGRTHEQALAALQEASGTQFDPQVVEVFLKLRGAQAGAAALEAA